MSILGFWGCSKETVFDVISPEKKQTINQENAASWYLKTRKIGVNSATGIGNPLEIFANAKPKWEKGITEFSRFNREFFSVPTDGLHVKRGGVRFLVSKDTSDNLIGNQIIFIADSLYHIRTKGRYNVKDFSGVILFLNLNSDLEKGLYFQKGKLEGHVTLKTKEQGKLQTRSECYLHLVQSTHVETTGSSGSDGACDGCLLNVSSTIDYNIHHGCPGSLFNTVIENNLQQIWGAVNYDVILNAQNPLPTNGSNSTPTSPNPTYQSTFVDPNVLYVEGLPASLMDQDQAFEQYESRWQSYAQSGYFTESEFSYMYWTDTELFKQVDGFLSVSKSDEFWQVAKEHYDLYNSNPRYKSLSQNFGEPKARLLEFLRRYKNQGKTSTDLINNFEKIVADSDLKKAVDDFLNKALGDGGRWDAVEEVAESYEANSEFREDSKLYFTLYDWSPDFAEVSNTLNSLGTGGGGSGVNMTGVLLDLVMGGVEEVVGSLLGLDDLKELRTLLDKGVQQGGRLAFKATRIVLRFVAKKNPVVNGLFTLDKVRTVYGKISRVHKRLNGLFKNTYFVGIEQKLEKVYESLKKNKLLNDLDVDPNGGLLTNSSKDGDVWNDLVQVFGKNPVSDGRGNGGLKFEIDDFTFNWYPNSDTYNRPTIEISYDSPSLGRKGTIIKIRF